MVVKELFKELELQLSDIAFTGIYNVPPVTLRKLEELKKWMQELNMAEGILQTDRLITTLTDYKNGKATVDETVSALCALEFYEKVVSGSGND